MSIKELALSLGKSTWKTIRWREGSADWLESRFARVRSAWLAKTNNGC